MGRYILPFFSSVVDACFLVPTLFLFLLFASRPSILPVLMWQAWEMKNWYFMSGEGGPLLSRYACKRGQKRKKNLLWVFTMTQTARFTKWPVEVSEHQSFRLNASVLHEVFDFEIFVSAACHNCSYNIKTQLLLQFLIVVQNWAQCPPDVFTIRHSYYTGLWTWSINDLISIDSTKGQEKEERSEELQRGVLQRQGTSSP